MRQLVRNIWFLITLPFRILIWLARLLWRWIATIAREIRGFMVEEVEDRPMGEVLSDVFETPSILLPELNALRRHLMRAALFMAVMTTLAFTFNRQILDFLTKPLEGGMNALVAIEVTEPISTVMRVTLLAGFTLSFPYIALELWLFIAPGLKSPRSRMYGLLAIPVATLFFVGGMAFAFYVMLPTALPFLLNFMGIHTIPRPSSYISFVTNIMFWIGISFQYPLIIFVLAKIGIIKAKVLVDQWRLAVVIIAVIAAVVTPTVDPINMSLVMLPLLVLYIISILLARIAQRSIID
jgi:sec-independent protein translocase protein TatC